MTKEEKNQLAEENLGLIYAVINKKFNFENVTEEDKKNYFEEGMIGLAIAINNYDTSVDSKFSSYAFTCIKNEICKYIDKQKCYKRKTDSEYKKSIDEYIDGDKKLTYKYILVNEKEDYISLINKEYILNTIEQIDIKDIKFIVSKRIEGYTYKEIGIALEISKQAVHTRIKNLKKNLLASGVII